MALQGAYTYVSPVASGDTTLPIAVRDPVIRGAANDGVRFLFDLAFGFCYPGGPIATRPAPGAPAQNAVIYDMMERANGRVGMNTAGGGAMTYSGGGFDLSGTKATGQSIANPPGAVMVPASVSADIYAAYGAVGGVGGVAQRPLLVAYVKLPASAAWVSGGIATLIGDQGYVSTPSMIAVGMSYGSVPQLQVRRQTALNAYDGATLTPSAGSFGTLAQIAAWRNAGGNFLRMRTATETLIASVAAGADNTQNFAANELGFGRSAAFAAGDANYNGARIYRGWVENLARSGRDPATVLDEDWARVQARIAASAAANGGSSLIFV